MAPEASDSDASVEELHRAARAEEAALGRAAELDLEFLNSEGPRNTEDAIRRFRMYRRLDPFPSVAPGLLSCAAFCAYITKVGIVFPGNLTIGSVQSASLDLPLLGKAVWWDERGERRNMEVGKRTVFELRRQSFAFVTLEPYLQLPDYIAMRFNLRVRNAYRGLLLGTGPLIDPGYQGYLSIPLHNLTNNDYVFFGGDGLISVEFTKLDPRSVGARELETPGYDTGGRDSLVRVKVPFPEPRLSTPDPNREHPISLNLQKAAVASVASSLPALRAAIEEQKTIIKRISIAGAIGASSLLVAIGAIMWQATGEMREIASRDDSAVESAVSQTLLLSDSVEALRHQIQAISEAVCSQARDADSAATASVEIRWLCRNNRN